MGRLRDANNLVPTPGNVTLELGDVPLLAHLLETLPEPVLCVDPALVVRYANEASVRALGGVAGSTLLGRRLGSLAHPLAGALLPLCQQVLSSGQARTRTELAVPIAPATPQEPGSAPYFVDVDALPVKGEGGRIRAITLVLRDVTERVLLREAHRAADEKAHLLARALQSDVLVRESLGPIPGYQLAFSYRPMDTEHDLGGDFFDGFRLGPSAFGLALGDVCGKGLGAVLDTAVIKFFLKAFARDARQPADVLTKAHRAAREEEQFQNFATVFYALLDTQAHTLTWTNAAHEPPLLVRAGGAVEELTASGVPLGLSLVESPGYEQRVAYLKPGDLLLLWTDGVTEARNTRREWWGCERLRALTRERRRASPQEIVNQIEEEVAAFGGAQTDDRIVIALKRDDWLDVTAPYRAPVAQVYAHRATRGAGGCPAGVVAPLRTGRLGTGPAGGTSDGSGARRSAARALTCRGYRVNET